MRLKNNGMMPGGLQFQDPRVPSMRWTDGHTGLEERIRQVIRFRLQNPLIYSPTDGQFFDFQQVGIEIVNFNCSRIGNDPHWCYDEAKPQTNLPQVTAPVNQPKCTACGMQLVPRYCKTCGGAKINGWDCPACGKST